MRPPTTFGVVRDRVVGAAGIDPLGREGELEVLAGGEARLLEDRQQPLAGGARIGGRLEHDQLALAQDARRAPRPALGHVAEVGLALVGERRRNADQHRVALAERGGVGRGLQAVADRGDALVGHVLDPAAAGGQALDRAAVDVEADDVVTRLRKRDRQRQADVAEADDPYFHARGV